VLVQHYKVLKNKLVLSLDLQPLRYLFLKYTIYSTSIDMSVMSGICRSSNGGSDDMDGTYKQRKNSHLVITLW